MFFSFLFDFLWLLFLTFSHFEHHLNFAIFENAFYFCVYFVISLLFCLFSLSVTLSLQYSQLKVLLLLLHTHPLQLILLVITVSWKSHLDYSYGYITRFLFYSHRHESSNIYLLFGAVFVGV